MSIVRHFEVTVKGKWLTREQAQELRKQIYTAHPQLDRNAQIIVVAATVKVAAIRGYEINPNVAGSVAKIIENFETTPESVNTAATMNYLSMVAVSGYKAPSKRSRSLKGVR